MPVGTLFVKTLSVTMYRQRTIREAVDCVGIGLHTGKKVSLRVRPAPVDTGIVFIRTDLPGTPSIKASIDNVVDTSYATTIGRKDVKVSTIEHLMASFAGLGIDNAYVDVDAPEVPIMDGSAAPFLFLLKSGGIRPQQTGKRFMVIKKTIKAGDRDSFIKICPSKEFKLSCVTDFNHPLLKNQSYAMSFSDAAFEKELSRARTFCFLEEVENLRSKGLIKGGSLDSAIVIDDFRVINEEGLRYKDEFVRHKMLDAIGDISLLGMPVIGHLAAYRAGHGLNHKLASEVLANPRSWKVVEAKEKDFEKLRFNIPGLQGLEPSITH